LKQGSGGAISLLFLTILVVHSKLKGRIFLYRIACKLFLIIAAGSQISIFRKRYWKQITVFGDIINFSGKYLCKRLATDGASMSQATPLLPHSTCLLTLTRG